MRRQAKEKVFVTNCLRALRQVSPGGSIRDIAFVVLVGGSSLDFEIPQLITEALSHYGVVAGQGNIREQKGRAMRSPPGWYWPVRRIKRALAPASLFNVLFQDADNESDFYLNRAVRGRVSWHRIAYFLRRGLRRCAAGRRGQLGQWEISIIWGLGVAMAIYLTAGVSGAHLNPAVTIALWLFACFERRKVLPFIVAQTAGAFCAAALVYGLYRQLSSILNRVSISCAALPPALTWPGSFPRTRIHISLLYRRLPWRPPSRQS